MNKELQITKALSDGNRLRVIMALTMQKELCVCQITELLQLATPTASRHMSVLQTAGLVTKRKDSRWVYYRLADAFPPLLRQWLWETLIHADQIANDQETIKGIVGCELEALCKAQKLRRRNQEL